MAKEKKQLEVFYAVTLNGVYEVKAQRDENGIPIVIGIKSFNKPKNRVKVGDHLLGGSHVGVTRIGIILYNAYNKSRAQKPELVNSWGDQTSRIVALFLRRKEALSVPKPDGRKMKKLLLFHKDRTLETLEAIGDNHSVFIVSEHHNLGIAERLRILIELCE